MLQPFNADCVLFCFFFALVMTPVQMYRCHAMLYSLVFFINASSLQLWLK